MFPFKIQDELLKTLVKEHFSEGPVFTSIDQLNYGSPSEEEMVRVKTAKVIHANYKLLQHDFPQLSDEVLEQRHPKSFPDKKEELIDAWLIENTAFISKPQADQKDVNTEIDCGDETTKAYRPPLYGRAVIYSIVENIKSFTKGEIPKEKQNDLGLIDVKGTGVAPGKKPSFTSHRDGLLTLDDALIEYVNQQLVQGAFMHANCAHETLPFYAIIDLGFNVRRLTRYYTPDTPATLLVRRAHTRPKNKGGLPLYASKQQHLQLHVERLLRKYGITSTNFATNIKLWKKDGKLKVKYGKTQMKNLSDDQLKNIEEVSRFKGGFVNFDGVNIQHTGEYSFNPGPQKCQVIDFGSFETHPVFKNPILSLVSDRLMRWGGSIFQGSKQYVQPDSEIAVPDKYWGKNTNLFGFETEYETFKRDIICKSLAQSYLTGAMDAKQMIELLDAYLQTATILWRDKIFESANKET